MNEKVLVAYASMMGATTGIARVIGDVLRAGGVEVHVLPVNQVGNVENYRSVVLGSPIYEGRWLENAVVFLEQYREFLSRIPGALFVVCTELRDKPEERRLRVQRYLDPILRRTPQIKPIDDIGIFTGSFSSKQWPLPTLLALKARGELPPDGDYRDWNAIRAWATHIRPLLMNQTAAAGV
jgi:menaquinone-dependent protoporphyrinogen oxidase